MPLGPIGNYAELRAAIIDWAIPGGEPNFNAAVPTFIRLAEARFDRELERHNSIGTSIMTTDHPYPGWPADWNETISITELGANGSARGAPLYPLTIAQGEDLEGYGVGVPRYYAIVDGGFRLIPAPNASRQYRLTYYRELERLSDTNQSNWLLDGAPDLYLFAALTEAMIYLKDDERMVLPASRTAQIIEAMNNKSMRQEYARGRPLVRAATFG